MRRRSLWAALVAAAAMAVLAVLLHAQRGPKPPTLRVDDPARLALGEQVYRSRCAVCHGAHLEGQPHWRERGPDGLLPAPPHDASGHTWHHPDEVLFRITKYGVARVAEMPDYRSAMPAYDGVLSDEEIVAALSWIKSQWPADVRARQEEVDRAHRDQEKR